MSAPLTPTPAPRRRRRRLLYFVCLLLLLLIAIPACGHLYLRWSTARVLAEAVAEAERMDPDWRWKQLAAKVANVPPEEDGIRQIRAVENALPKHWSRFTKSLLFPNERQIPESDRAGLSDKFATLLEEMPSQRRLNGQQVQALQDELAMLKQALHEARKMANFSRGVPEGLAKGYLGGPHLPVLEVLRLLEYDAMLLAHAHKSHEALNACRAILSTGVVAAEQLDGIRALARCTARYVAADVLQRVLAQGTATPEALNEMYAALREEEGAPLASRIAVLDRAGIDSLWSSYEAGDPGARELETWILFKGKDTPPSAHFLAWYKCDMQRERGRVLREHNAHVAASRLPPEQFWPRLREMQERRGPITMRNPMLSNTEAALRTQMLMRVAYVGIAIEVYRSTNNRWPEKLDDLVPACLDAVPYDFFDPDPSQRLRYRRLKDGVVVYSVGTDGVDHGGRIRMEIDDDIGNRDIGFRLWNPESRRQEPLPPLRIPDAATDGELP